MKQSHGSSEKQGGRKRQKALGCLLAEVEIVVHDSEKRLFGELQSLTKADLARDCSFSVHNR